MRRQGLAPLLYTPFTGSLAQPQLILILLTLFTDTMYSLTCADGLSFGSDVYVLDIHRTSAGLASIASDQHLSLLDPTRLSAGPLRRLPTEHGNLNCLRVFDANASLVCTAGENGTVGVWDLRQGARVAQFQGKSMSFERV